ncbi:MAG TPA: AMP-binding protein [Euzebyales bacterium]|nr:AMP-binding protein [Euzebyales bacterium]
MPATRLLDDAAQDFPDAVAVEYRRYRLSYRKLADHVDRFATALEDLAAGPGSEVAVLLPNCPQLVITLFAAWRVGAHVRLLRPSDARALAGSAPAVVVVLDRWYGEHVAPLRGRMAADARVVVTGLRDYLHFPANVLVPVRRLLRGRPLRIPEREGVLGFADLVRRHLPAPEEPAGVEKLDALHSARDGDISQRRLVVNSFQLRLWLPDVVAGDERVLLAIPLSSALGVVWIVTAVLAGATMIVVDDRRAAARQRSAVRARPTILPFDRKLARQLVRAARGRATMASVRIAITRDDLGRRRRRAMEELTDKGRVRRVWGGGDLLTHADPVYGRYVEDTVGLPLPDTAAVVADPADPTRSAPAGTRGRLWLRGPQLGGDHWVDAGVDATLDGDGYLTVHGDERAGAASG